MSLAEACVHCKKTYARLHPRGLCRRCFDNIEIRSQYPAGHRYRAPRPVPPWVCKHCKQTKTVREHGRGLCQQCFRTPGVKDQYPLPERSYAYRGKDVSANMTDAELDALIAEQYPTMPVRGSGKWDS